MMCSPFCLMREKGDVIVMSTSYPNYLTSVHSLNQLPFFFFFLVFCFSLHYRHQGSGQVRQSEETVNGNNRWQWCFPNRPAVQRSNTGSSYFAQLPGQARWRTNPALRLEEEHVLQDRHNTRRRRKHLCSRVPPLLLQVVPGEV